MSSKRITFSILLLALLFLSGCYRVALTDLDHGTVYYKGFRNSTFYHQFDEYFNSDLATLIAESGTLELSNDAKTSDYILSGNITSIYKNVIRTRGDDIPLEYQYVCVIELRFENTVDPSQSIKRTLRRSWRYLPPYGETQESALKKLSRFLAEELLLVITTKW